MKNKFSINGKYFDERSSTYFIADIASSHDGELSRAIDLIYQCAEAGANAAKFQHFQAESIVSDYGFKKLGSSLSHQASWKKSVFQTYKDAETNLEWTPKLKEAANKAGIDFFTSPYSSSLVDHVDKYIEIYKIGSGDITDLPLVKYIASKKKPYIVATGAASLQDVRRLYNECININPDIAIMQCNTNYTGSLDNFKYINLRVLDTYKINFPGVPLGLSDHTPGHATVLGAIAKGARLIEKHFTDDNDRNGPDHSFSMNPVTWKDMVDRSRELELSLGSASKIIEDNELETVVLQRRAIRAKRDLIKGQVINLEDIIALRPCPREAIRPFEINEVIGKTINLNLQRGDIFKWDQLS